LQVKRIHEYKRQFLNVLGVIHRYHTIKSMDASERSKVCNSSHLHDCHVVFITPA
jgi:glucan phosphorylase